MNQVQKRILRIFETIAAICEENGIDYFAIGGTCIGAIRHKGFIPWDDDLDIAVPVEQFFKLRDILKKSLPAELEVYECNDVMHYHYIFIKVQDTSTTFIQNTLKQYPDAYTGVFVDIMPLGGIPSEPTERHLFINKLKLLRIFNNVRRFPFCKQESGAGKIASLILKLPLSLFRFNYFSNKYYEVISKYKYTDSSYVGYVWSPQSVERLCFPKEWFETYSLQDFEDIAIKCPINYDAYLKQHFGDYMELPPQEKRVEVHPAYVDLEHSYKDYQTSKELTIF